MSWSLLLSAATIAAVEQTVAPPVAQRAKRRFEVEIETPEATFTLRYDQGVVTVSKGFASDPLLAMTMPATALTWVGDLLDVVVAGFPQSAELGRWLAVARQTSRADAEACVDALNKLSSVAVAVDIKGVGKVVFARGPVEEAAKVVTLQLSEQKLRSLWTGASPATLAPAMSGDRAVLASLATAFAPLLGRLRRP
jgi:hypothetical protein